jgi:hypothetical protein
LRKSEDRLGFQPCGADEARAKVKEDLEERGWSELGYRMDEPCTYSALGDMLVNLRCVKSKCALVVVVVNGRL